jgi:hypothetical protein
MTKETKTVGWQISVNAIDQFCNYCDSVNDNYGDAVSAAMVIWQYLPPSVQRQAQLAANGVPAVDKNFWKEFSRGLDDAILHRVRNPNYKE